MSNSKRKSNRTSTPKLGIGSMLGNVAEGAYYILADHVSGGRLSSSLRSSGRYGRYGRRGSGGDEDDEEGPLNLAAQSQKDRQLEGRLGKRLNGPEASARKDQPQQQQQRQGLVGQSRKRYKDQTPSALVMASANKRSRTRNALYPPHEAADADAKTQEHEIINLADGDEDTSPEDKEEDKGRKPSSEHHRHQKEDSGRHQYASSYNNDGNNTRQESKKKEYHHGRRVDRQSGSVGNSCYATGNSLSSDNDFRYDDCDDFDSYKSGEVDHDDGGGSSIGLDMDFDRDPDGNDQIMKPTAVNGPKGKGRNKTHGAGGEAAKGTNTNYGIPSGQSIPKKKTNTGDIFLTVPKLKVPTYTSTVPSRAPKRTSIGSVEGWSGTATANQGGNDRCATAISSRKEESHFSGNAPNKKLKPSRDHSDILKSLVESAERPDNKRPIASVASTPTKNRGNGSFASVSAVASASLPKRDVGRDYPTLNLTKVDKGKSKKKNAFPIKPGCTHAREQRNARRGGDSLQSWQNNNAGGESRYGSTKDDIDCDFTPSPSRTSRSTRKNKTLAGSDASSPLIVDSPSDKKKRPRRRSERTKESPEIVEIGSSESEAEDSHDQSTITLKRFVWEAQDDQEERRHNCRLSFDNERKEIVLHSKARHNSKATDSILINVTPMNVDRLFYLDDKARRQAAVEGMDLDDNMEGMLVLVMNYQPVECMKFGGSPATCLDRAAEGRVTKFFMEFTRDHDLRRLVEDLDESGTFCLPMTRDNKELWIDAVPEPKNRSFVQGKKSDEILLVYPFPGYREKIDERLITEGLTKELSLVHSTGKKRTARGSAAEGRDQSTETLQNKQRSHFLIVRVGDYKRLIGRKWLNDTLVDLWMQWLSRGEDDLQSSDIHVFTSHFYTTLREDGPKSVQSWTEKKNINIFNKKMVFIPINQTLHWSLCVLIHPGAVGGPNEKRSKYPCMLFMDSLRMHDSETVEKNVYAWLNQEWDRLKKDPPGASRRGMRKSVFEPASYPCISPKVPRQRNGCDCGVFVCRYAYGIYQLAGTDLTYDTVWPANDRKPFQMLIEESGDFFFGAEDIKQIREDFQIFIQRLSKIYHESKDEEKMEKRKKPKDAVAAQTAAAMTTTTATAVDGNQIDEKKMRATDGTKNCTETPFEDVGKNALSAGDDGGKAMDEDAITTTAAALSGISLATSTITKTVPAATATANTNRTGSPSSEKENVESTSGEVLQDQDGAVVEADASTNAAKTSADSNNAVDLSIDDDDEVDASTSLLAATF